MIHTRQNDDAKDAPIDVGIYLVIGGLLTGVIFFMFKHYLDLSIRGKLVLVLVNFARMFFYILALVQFYDPTTESQNKYQIWLVVSFNAAVFACFEILNVFLKYEVDFKEAILKHQKEELEKEKIMIAEAKEDQNRSKEMSTIQNLVSEGLPPISANTSVQANEAQRQANLKQ